MAKLLLIVRYEWRLMKADRTALLITSLFAVALGCGIFGGARWIKFQQSTILQLQNEESERYRALFAQAQEIESNFGAANQTNAENWDPRNPYYIGNTRGPRYAFLPPAPLAVTAIGQSDLYPYYFKVSTDLKQNFSNPYELENPLKLLVGRFDLAFVLIWLYPLLILGLSFNLLAGERDSGVLALLLSQPVSLRRLALGKVIVRALMVFTPVIIFTLIGLLIGGENLASLESLSRFGLWTVAAMLYGGFWFALAALVNARASSAATNALILAGAWLLFVVLLPSSINAIASAIYPVPSRVEYIQSLREASDGEVAERSKLMAAFYEDHPELAKGTVSRRDEFTLTKEKLNERMAARIRPVTERFERQIENQQRVIGWFRFLTPALLMQESLNDIAGTGQGRYRHFSAQVDRFHQNWKDFFNPFIARRELVACDDFARFPAYNYREEAIESLASRLVIPFFGMATLAALIGSISFFFYLRFRVV
ncbi:MAG TPA: DUF3526 domain-containing protein [Blastocatellia bacterium]|nr:DUF3526 domain-containing protein [Blastocatellia bacterium]